MSHPARGPLRIAIVGSASSGKTTLAQALAERYGDVWVPEYLREFVDLRGRVPVEGDQLHIAETQAAREDLAAARASRFLFCDTTPLMTAVYSRHYFGRIAPGLAQLVAARRYDMTLVCAPDVPWQPDGLQREPEDQSAAVNALLSAELAARAIPHVRIHGPLAQRLQQVEDVLGR
ncbi:NadR type nicotinamide-nucleotide adenylyltransferase [Pseudoduganella lurida]|uniref:NadR type nicotinamide-nucleotide adenylyltransferase n=1 Tax=Pseudoduganella lurida TaxID=1036180 RepID=A0A562RBX2_9BURK|nr:ATP-binding protein [Pseudoduganella lurida]TWI66559.1 NadR type nicotinamide-nucleotide adenylyltransferase [Pseudoduganella lurida]